MAKRNNITTDPAVVARQRMLEAGENDKEYDAAFEALADARATTLEGVGAQIEAYRSYVHSGGILCGEVVFAAMGIRQSVIATVAALMDAPRGKDEMFF